MSGFPDCISNMDDTIDVRDVIARVEHLESELTDAWEGEGNSKRVTLDEWLAEASESPAHVLQDAAAEFVTLSAFLGDLAGNGGDEQWRGDWYPVTLIRDSYFKEYAQELAEEIGAIPDDASWPCRCIDWEKAAWELRMDYTSADFDGQTYWFR